MSLKRLLNDDEDVYYPPAHSPFFSQPESATMTYSSGFPRPDMVSPSSTSTDPVEFIPDATTTSDDPSGSLTDVFSELLSSGFGADYLTASMYNLDTVENPFDNLDQSLELWAAETMGPANGSSSSPSQQTPTPVPSLTQDTTSHCSSVTTDDEEPADRVCYGMIHRVDVKLVGEMAMIDSKITTMNLETPNPYQRFALTHQPEHILLTFRDDNTEFGYLRSNMTKALDRLLKEQSLEFEAVSPSLNLRETIGRAKKASDAMVKVDINIYGPKSAAPMTGATLSRNKLWLQKPDHSRRDFPYDNPQVLAFAGIEQVEAVQREVTSGGPARRPQRTEQLRHLMTNVYGSLRRGTDLNRVQGSNQVTRKLLDHQQEALGFMLQRESGVIPEAYRLWKPKTVDGEEWFYHAITKNKCRVRPEEKGGGILADEMGMGKSLSILALIVNTLEDGQQWAEKQRTSDDANKSLHYSRSTLVVVSSALLINNWSNEVRMHLDGSLKVIRYHGVGRQMNLNVIEDSDIVITTYNTLSGEFSDKRSILHKIGWYRVVLDEAHIIRRQATTFHRACAELDANSRWCLTGTPIQNKLEDIGALFAFIKAKPFDSLAAFRRFIQTPFEQPGNENVDKVKDRLVLLLDSLCLRRTKDLLNLPGLVQRVRELKFTDGERKQYENMKKILARIIKQRVGQYENSKFGLFQANLQMRIMCNHGTYQQHFSWQRRSFRDEQEAAVSAIGNSVEITCSGCQQPMPILGSNKIYNIFVEKCGHVLCSECLEESDSKSKGSMKYHCPICHHRESVTFAQQPTQSPLVSQRMVIDGPEDVEMRDLPVVKNGEEDDDHYFRREGHSTKMEALIQDVKEDLWATKSIIFSCWTRTLNLVAKHLERDNVPYLRIDGDCPLAKRQKILDDFAADQNRPVLIMTTGTGAFGLNLTCANRVFIVELQWNPSVENQAIARAIRLGQGKEVIVTRYVIKNSIEEEMQSQQRWKLRIAEIGFEAS